MTRPQDTDFDDFMDEMDGQDDPVAPVPVDPEPEV